MDFKIDCEITGADIYKDVLLFPNIDVIRELASLTSIKENELRALLNQEIRKQKLQKICKK